MGFSLREGSVLSTHTSFFRVNHVFYLNDEDPGILVCLTPGQFINPGVLSEYKGQKIEDLLSRGPSLIRRFNNEIAALRGSVGDTQDQLGLTYLDQPTKELLGPLLA